MCPSMVNGLATKGKSWLRPKLACGVGAMVSIRVYRWYGVKGIAMRLQVQRILFSPWGSHANRLPTNRCVQVGVKALGGLVFA